MSRPAIGQPVRVRLSATDDQYFSARVVEHTDEHLYINIPLRHGDNQPLSPTDAQHIWVEFHGTDGSLNRYWTPVLGVVELPMLAFKLNSPAISTIEREQRREFVRVPADFPVRIVIPNGRGVQHADVRSRDISGGGMALMVPREVVLHPGMHIQAKFTLPNLNFPVDVSCEVIRVSDRNERGYASVSLYFINVREAVRQRIIQYTFARQRMIK